MSSSYGAWHKKSWISRKFFVFCSFVLLTNLLSAQANSGFEKGDFFFYWGYNRAFYSYSNIHFNGDHYNFTLRHVKASDRQSKLGANPYLRINQITIPQYNYRLGYHLNKAYSISFGFDHMKYVMNQGQTVEMNGFIEQTATDYNGVYDHRLIELNSDFLEFEHTDGLNYLNFEINRLHPLFLHAKMVKLNWSAAVSCGFLYPRSRVILLNQEVNDQWHVSGYGASLNSGLQLLMGKHFFLQTELKAGYINMPDIVISGYKRDHAKQHFTFLQSNLVLGYRFGFSKK